MVRYVPVTYGFRASGGNNNRRLYCSIHSRIVGCSTRNDNTLCATSATVSSWNWLENIQKQFFSTTTSDRKYYTIGITGSSGLVGTALRKELLQRSTICGKPIRIIQLKRSNSVQEFPQDQSGGNDMMIRWNPMNIGDDANTIIHPTVISEMDTIIHLAGENVATGLGPLGFLGIRPWTIPKKDEIMKSRVISTTALSKVISAAAESNGRPIQFLSASGVGIYGNHYIGNQCDAVDESMDVRLTQGFLSEVSRAWELAATACTANKRNHHGRMIQMRFGVVQSLNGGALAKLYPIFWLGGGGIVGNGKQYLSYISLSDIVRAVIHIMETPSIPDGPINLCTPYPCTNSEYTSALGNVLSRPTIVPLPAFIVQLLFGEMGQEMLLGGVRALPTKLLQSGFQFRHPTINDVLQYAIHEETKSK